MQQKIILNIINQQAKELFESLHEITIDKNILSCENGLELSSFDTMLLLIKIEERFNIDINSEIKTIRELVRLIESKGVV